MAKTRKKGGLSKQLQVAIMLGVVLAVMMYGGQLTGMATAGVANMTITISGVPSCAVTTAFHTALAADGGPATTTDFPSTGTDARLTNDGNTELIYEINASHVVNSFYVASSAVTLDVTSSGNPTETDVTAIGAGGTTTQKTFCDDVSPGEYCDFQFVLALTPTEPSATDTFEYDIECSTT